MEVIYCRFRGGALISNRIGFEPAACDKMGAVQPKQLIKTVCPYCGVGCGMLLQVENGRVTRAQGDPDHPANFGKLCIKGVTSPQTLQTGDRLSQAHVRTSKSESPAAVEMDHAIAHVAKELKRIIAEHGPDSIAFYVSGQLSTECQYVVNKLCKGFLGTNNIDSNSRLCMSSAASGYRLSLGADGPPGSYRDFELTNCFFVIGSNMAECHPILYGRMMAAKKQTGAKLIVVDPRKTATAEKADLYLPIRPGTDLALLNGLLNLMVQAGQVDPEFIAKNTVDWEQMTAFLADYSPEKVAEITGLAEADIRSAAKWMGEAKELMSLWTMGLNQSTHGTWQTNAICNIHLATGKICRPGSGPFSLTGQPNAMGGREVGYLSSGLPGQRSVMSAPDRAFVEKLWIVPEGILRSEPGLDAVTMFKKMEVGDVKAVWVIGTNPVVTMPARAGVAKALEKAELVIVQDVYFPTETGKYADVLLPGAVWAEAEGTMINSERMVTLMQKAVEPPGDALADWEIVTRVAREMGFAAAFSYETASDVFEEIKSSANPFTGYDLRGMSYKMLRQSAMQWPCGPEEVVGKTIRYVNQKGSLQFPTQTGRAHFFTRPFLPPAEMPDAEYPMILTTGRVLNQWHTMTKTGKVDQLNKLNPGPFLEIHPEDAALLNISDKQKVEVKSRRGSGIFPAKVTTHIRQGTCFAPFHWNDNFGENLAINAVTNNAYDAISKQPETKFCAVKLVPVVSLISPPGGATPIMNIDTEPPAASVNRVDGPFTPQQKEYLQGLITGMMITGPLPAHLKYGLPDAAPFNAAQRSWLSGLLAGALAKRDT